MPIDSLTKSLLHFDGADGATTTTDEAGRTWTFANNAQLDTAEKKFGTASLLLDASHASNRISTPSTNDLQLGSNDFTIDFQMKKNGSVSAGGYVFVSKLTNLSTNREFYVAARGTPYSNISAIFYTETSAVNYVEIFSPDLASDGNFHHVAIVRSGNSWGIAVDGIFGTFVTSSLGVHPYTSDLVIGQSLNTGFSTRPNCWIDEFRIKNGVAMWTSNFTPPTKPYGTFQSRIIMTGE